MHKNKSISAYCIEFSPELHWPPAAGNMPRSGTATKWLSDKFCNLSFLFYYFFIPSKLPQTKNVKKRWKKELGTFFFIIFLGSFFLVLSACSNATFDLREEKRKKKELYEELATQERERDDCNKDAVNCSRITGEVQQNSQSLSKFPERELGGETLQSWDRN